MSDAFKEEKNQPRDEPLDLNPWEANDPSGMSGRPPADPAPPHINRWRLVAVAVTLISALTYMLWTKPGTITLDDRLSMRLFPLVILLSSTRTMIPYFRNISVPAGQLGKRGWQKMYNKFRLALIFFALSTAILLTLWDFLDSQAGAPYRGVGFVVVVITVVLNLYMLFKLRQAAKDLSLEKEG